jgi:serine protease Do
MKKLTTSLGLILALLLLNAAMPQKAAASAGYLEKAERYTVKIRTRVKYPSREDKKGSFSGAGFLIDSKRGWIATNAHVTSRNPESVEVAFKDKAFTDAKLIFVDQYLDLAVLQIPFNDIPQDTEVAKLNCNIWPKVGSRVGAYGHPLSLDFSVTTGIVSGLRYRHNVYSIQTDAAINSGNSGGPLIDQESGDVIGINAATYSKKESEGLGFAVPIMHACKAFDLLRINKNPSPSYLPVAFARGRHFLLSY